MTSTLSAELWEEWARRDAYYAVLTDPRFRRESLDTQAKQAFFELGRIDVEHVLILLRRYAGPSFTPRRVLDFGCGVGRLLIPLAQAAESAVGVDISATMLEEARRNCVDAGLDNVWLLPSDPTLSAVSGQFDLVHSHIVLQHVEVPLGRQLFQALVDRIEAGGWGVIQVTFAWATHDSTFGQAPPAAASATPSWPARLRNRLQGSAGEATATRAVDKSADPPIPMHFYNLSELIYMVQRAGAHRVHLELMDHGGVYGAYLVFGMPAHMP